MSPFSGKRRKLSTPQNLRNCGVFVERTRRVRNFRMSARRISGGPARPLMATAAVGGAE